MIIKVRSMEGDAEDDLLFSARGLSKDQAICMIDEAIRKVKEESVEYGYVFEDLLEKLPRNIVPCRIYEAGEKW